LRQKNAAFASSQVTAQREIAALRQQIAATESETKAGEQQLPAKRPKKPTELSDKERFDRMIVKSDAQNQIAALQKGRRNMMRRLYQTEYGDLYTELNLPPKTLEQFKQLLVEKYEAYSDAAAIMAARGVSSFSPTGRSAIEQAQQMVEHDIESLLSEKDYATYHEYDRIRRDMMRLDSFQSWLSEKNSPSLNKAQVRTLSTACCDIRDKDRNNDYTAIANDLDGSIATQQILQRARGQLTPEQVQAFIAYREESDAAEKTSEAFIRGEAPLPVQKAGM
jgi:hypothetical protein